MTTQFKKYQHIEKLGTKEVDGILNGTCYLTYKIDGTNACVWYDKEVDELRFGSRNRELSLENDNANFMKLIKTDEKYQELYKQLKNFLKGHPNFIMYGEWLVPHTIKRYREDSWKDFYVFDIYDTESECYINYDNWTRVFDNHYTRIKYIPLIAKLINPTVEEIKSFLDKTGNFLVTEGLGEGIVIKNYEYVNQYGRIIWAKVLTEDFSKSKGRLRSENKADKEINPVEHSIINLMTVEHIQKEYHKLIELKDGWSSQYIFELLNRCFNEFIRDNWEIILKKFKMPTINFKVLKQLSDKYVKFVLNL